MSSFGQSVYGGETAQAGRHLITDSTIHSCLPPPNVVPNASQTHAHSTAKQFNQKEVRGVIREWLAYIGRRKLQGMHTDRRACDCASWWEVATMILTFVVQKDRKCHSPEVTRTFNPFILRRPHGAASSSGCYAREQLAVHYAKRNVSSKLDGWVGVLCVDDLGLPSKMLVRRMPLRPARRRRFVHSAPPTFQAVSR